jgi:ribosomal 30S subunit maturation factor RimM
MTYTTLKTTVAAIALTAGTAWAADDMDTKVEMDAETPERTEIQSAVPAIDEAEIDTTSNEEMEDGDDSMQAEAETPANQQMQDRSDRMQAENDAAPAQEVETLENAQMGSSTLVPDSSVGTMGSSEFDGMTVADLVGMDVETAAGEDVGEIDYVIEQNGELAAIVGVGGFLGLGEHDVAVPLTDLSISEEDEVTLANWDEEKLKAQPDLDESEITALEDETPIEIAS